MATISEDNIVQAPAGDVKFENSRTPYYQLILNGIEDVLNKQGDYVCMELVDTGSSMRLSEVPLQTRNIASALMRRGFKKGDVVCTYTFNNLEFYTLTLATWICGGCISMAIPYDRPDDLRHQLENCNARWLLVEPDTIEMARKALSGLPGGTAAWQGRVFIVGGDDPAPKAAPNAESIQDLINDDGTAYPSDVAVNFEEDVIYLPYSSGTTGRPKGVMHTNYSLNYSHWSYGLTPQSMPVPEGVRIKMLMTNGMYHLTGSLFPFMFITKGLWCGAFHRPDNSDSILIPVIEKHKPHILSVLPQQLNMLSVLDLEKYDFSSVKMIVTGGAQSSPAVLQQLSAKLKYKAVAVSAYGTTETLGVTRHSLINPMSMKSIKGNSGINIGGALIGVQAKVVDIESGKNLGALEEGEIAFKSPGLAKGYLNRPEATAVSFRDGWYYTGDFGFYNKDGCFYFLERIKELLKYKNLQVAPAELEVILNEHPEVKDAVVIGIPDEQCGDLPRAYVCLADGATVTAKELQKLVDDNVSDYKRLRGGVVMIDSIPRNQAGKPIRKKLLELAMQEK